MNNALSVASRRHLIGVRSFVSEVRGAHVRHDYHTVGGRVWIAPASEAERVYQKPRRYFRSSIHCNTTSSQREHVSAESISRSRCRIAFSQPSYAHEQSRRKSTGNPLNNSVGQSKKQVQPKARIEAENAPETEGQIQYTQEQVNEIFRREVDLSKANLVLNTIQHRRVSGSLIDEELSFSPEAGIEPELPGRALQYLRRTYLVDEQAAGQAYAEREAQRIEDELIARSESLGLYKRREDEKPADFQGREADGQGVFRRDVEIGSSHPQELSKEDYPYGRSGLDEIKAYYESQHTPLDKEAQALHQATESVRAEKIQEQQQQQQDSAQTSEGSLLARPQGDQALTTPRKKAEWLEYYEKRAQLSTMQEVARMTNFARLFPTTVVAILTISLCCLFASFYHPPPRAARLWPDTPPAAATVLTIIGLNVAVWLAWKMPPLYRSMNKYFLQVPGYPFALSVVGNVFSHQQLSHLGMNMLLLWFLGTRCMHELSLSLSFPSCHPFHPAHCRVYTSPTPHSFSFYSQKLSPLSARSCFFFFSSPKQLSRSSPSMGTARRQRAHR